MDGVCIGAKSGVCCDGDVNKCCIKVSDCGPVSFCKNNVNYSWECNNVVCEEQKGELCEKYVCTVDESVCGISCIGLENCLVGHICADGVCVVLVGVGEFCKSIVECGDGLICQNEVCCLVSDGISCCNLNVQCDIVCDVDVYVVYFGKCDVGVGGIFICGLDWGGVQ